MYGLEKLKQNLSDFCVVMTDKIHESQTYSFSTRLTFLSSHVLKLNESILFSREDFFTRKFLVINNLKEHFLTYCSFFAHKFIIIFSFSLMKMAFYVLAVYLYI